MQPQRWVIDRGIVPEAEYEEAVRLYKICAELGIQLPLSEVILHRFASTIDRQRYLRVLVAELEPPVLKKAIDPYGMDLGGNWDSQLRAMQEQQHDHRELDLCRDIQKDMKQRGLSLSLSHIMLLRAGDVAHSAAAETSSQSESRTPHVTLETFCQRLWKSKLPPPATNIDKLSRRFFKEPELVKILRDQRELEEKWQLKVPLVHLLIARYKVDAPLLHALLLAQMSVEEGRAVSRLGQTVLRKFSVDQEQAENMRRAQAQAQEFLQWSFTMQWLKFTAKQQFSILASLDKAVDEGKMAAARDIQHRLQQQKLLLDVLKILYLCGAVSSEKLVATVLETVYGVSPKQKLGQTMRSPKVSVHKKPQPGTAVETLGGELPRTVKQASKKAPRATSKVAARLMERLQQQNEEAAPPEEKETEAATQDKRPKKERATSKRLVQRSPDKPDTGKREMQDIANERDIPLVRLALKEEFITEEQAVDAAILQFDKRRSGVARRLLDVLRDQNFLEAEKYRQLANADEVEDEPPVKAADRLDMVLANTLLDYNMIERDRLQRCLGVQSVLSRLGIRRSLDSLLIYTKTLAPEIVLPMADKCRQKIEEAKAKPEIEQHSPARVSARPRSRRSPAVQMALGGFSIICLVFAVWQVYSAFTASQAKPPQPRINTTRVPEKTVEKRSPRVDTSPTSDDKTETERQQVRRATPPGYERWQKSTVSKEEKEFLEQNWSEREKVSVEFVDGTVEHIERSNRHTLVVKGKLQMPSLPENRRLAITLQVFDKNKSKSYSKLERRFFWRPGQKIVAYLGPFFKPLPPDFYYLRVALQPTLQSPLVRELLEMSTALEWWVVFGQSRQEIEAFYKAQSKLIGGSMKRLRRQIGALEKLVARAQAGKEKQAWRDKLAAWHRSQRLLTGDITRYRDSYFVSVFPETEESLFHLTKKMEQRYESLKKWAAGQSLIAPDPMGKGILLELLERAREQLQREAKLPE